jgi:NAD(P)-dependent dehydrogenase (short-subunit alcohol dehydrogenase family)
MFGAIALTALAHANHARARAPGVARALASASGSAAAALPRLTLTPNAGSVARLADPDAAFVVTGGSQGIGLEFCRALLARSRGTVFALSRTPERAEGLVELAAQYGARLRPVAVDLTSPPSIERAAAAISGASARVDVLVNCAGMLHDGSAEGMPERSLAACNADWMHRVYALNAVAPVLLTAALAPLLSKPPADGRARVVANLSARVGSVSDNRLGGWWGYRMSKAALNMATRNMAIELGRKRVLAIALHPGTTDTGLSKPFQKNVRPEKLFTTAYSVERMLAIIECVEPEHSGNLFAWDGEHVPF